MAAPVRFETIAKSMNVDLATVEEWSKVDGFPASGKGVAVLVDVAKWRLEVELLQSGSAIEIAEPEKQNTEPLAEEIPAMDDQPAGVRWVKIQVPLLMSGAVLPGINPVHSLRIRSSEHHIRDVWGKLLHGCREEKVRLKDGRPVRESSDTLKYVFELISRAVNQG